MKIKRYTARDMRQAMQKVREDQGPDAVILSSRRSDGMVEIVAAIDYDEALVREAVEPLRAERETPAAVAVAELASRSVAVAETPKPVRPATPAASVAALAKSAPAKPVATSREESALRPSVAEARAALEASATQLRMRDEIGELRQLLESQLSSLAWNDLDRRHPLRARVLRD